MNYTRQILGALFNWRTLLSVATSLALLALLLGIISATGQNVNLETLGGILRSMPVSLLLAYLGIQLIGTLFRASRYQLLIRAAGETNVPGFGHMYLVTMIRNMVVDMLPARLGELLFIAMLNRGYNVRANACISSLSLSIVLDVAILVPVLFVLSAIPLANAAMQQGMLPIAVVVIVAVTIVLLMMYPVLTYVTRLMTQWSEHGSSRWLKKLAGFVADIHEAFEETRRSHILGRALLLTVGVRIAKYSALYCLFLAATMPTMTTLQSLAPWEVLSTLIASEATASVPLPTFMSFGSYEAGGLAALTLLGYPAVDSAMAVLSMHIASQSIDYMLGGIGIILFYFAASNWRMTITSTVNPPRPWLTGASALAIVGALALLVSQYGQFKASRYLVPPPAGNMAATGGTEKDKAKNATRGLDGFVVWSSNRYGNHDIVKLSLPDWTLTRLTTHPNSEYFPRISPDGRQIVFSRGKRKWVSHGEPESWDVVLLDLDSGKERMLARGGNTPTWSEDGNKVFFQRDREQFVEIDVKSGKERVLFKSGTKRIPAGVELQTPNYSTPRQQLAVSFRGTRRMTTLVHQVSGIKRQIGYGCQLTWSPKADYVYWVDEKGGRMKNHIKRLDLPGKEDKVWLDLPGKYSHEYFPKVSNTGEYMVLGASAGGHAHDSADYEMFLWKIGTPASGAVRLSYHTGNDNWPDIYLKK